MATTENYDGSDATGSSGGSNRTLTLSNTQLTVDDGLIVVVANTPLHPANDFTISHLSSSSIITFLNALWDDQAITVTYDVSISASAGSAGVIPLDGQLIANEIAYFGSTITLRVVTDSSYSDWGDPTESTADTEDLKAMVQVMSQEDELVKDGIFQSGDKIFWFTGSTSNITRGNRIQHNSLWYEIFEVIEHDTGDVTYCLEARTKKV